MSLILAIRNISDLAPISDYAYEVLLGDGTATGSRVITSGEIVGHRRTDGWQVLVEKVLEKENTWTSLSPST